MDVTSLLGGGTFGANRVAVQEHPSGGWWCALLATRWQARWRREEAGLPVASALGLTLVLSTHPTDPSVLMSGALVRISFWVALWMALVASAK